MSLQYFHINNCSNIHDVEYFDIQDIAQLVTGIV